MSTVSEIKAMLMKGKAKDVEALVTKALAEGTGAAVILNEGLLSGMGEIGEKFKKNEVYVPEVLIAARAMKAVVDAVKNSDLKGKLKVMIGGAPVTQAFCDEIGADGYAPDAASASDLAKKLIP